MHPSLFCVIVLLVPLIDKGYGIRCYLCSSKESEDCQIPRRDRLKLVNCSSAALEQTARFAKAIDYGYEEPFRVDGADIARNIDFNCLKVVTKVGFKHYVLRGCQLAEQNNLDICRKLKAVNTNQLHLEQCARCATDDCNSSSTIYSFKSLIFFTIATAFTSFGLSL